jgi:hypothetical protein
MQRPAFTMYFSQDLESASARNDGPVKESSVVQVKVLDMRGTSSQVEMLTRIGPFVLH